jgi:hypothetical protein
MELTNKELERLEKGGEEIKVVIPEGENTLWITRFATRKDEDGTKRQFIKKRKPKNLRERDYWYITDVQLADKDGTGRILTTQIYWNESENKLDYVDFAIAGQAEFAKLDEGKSTERTKFEAENRADDDTLAGIVGRAITVNVVHVEKVLKVPKKDEAGNQEYDAQGKWVMEVINGEDGQPIKFVQEYVARDKNKNPWRYIISKSNNKELFFIDNQEDDLLDLPEPELPKHQQDIINSSPDGQPF